MKNIRQTVAILPSDGPSCRLLVKAKGKHKQRDRHAAEARVEKRLSAQTIHQHQGDHGREHIGNGNQKRGENRALIRTDPGKGKYLRAVIEDGVDTGSRYQHHEANGDEERAAHRRTPKRAPAALHFSHQADANVFQ